MARDWTGLLTQLTPEVARRRRAAGDGGGESLHESLERWAAKRGDRLAVVDSRGRLSYAELGELVDTLAGALLSLGVERGDVVAFQLPKWRESGALVIACSRIGAVFLSIAPIFRERELGRMLKLAQPKVLITADEFRGYEHARVAADLLGDVESPPRLVVIGAADGLGLPWSDFLAGAHRATGLPRPDPDSVLQLAFTSGTTGEPKGILHTHETLLHPARHIAARYELTDADRLHMASTLGHQTGTLYGICLPVMLGAPAMLQDRWNADEFCELVEREGVTWTCGAIPFVSDLLASRECERRDLSSLRLFGCFGSGLPEALASEAAQRLPGCLLFGGWGMTECGLPVSNPIGDSLANICESEGIPVPAAELQIRSADLTQVELAGVEGEVLFRGPGRHLGFLQPELSRELFIDDDWYVTGDRGCLREDGYFVMSGRSKDLIVRGGENIPVAEVENLLLRHSAVRACAVVAYPDDRLGERACACVVLRGEEPFDLDALRSWVKDAGLTPQYWPERVEVFEEMPMTPSGKIQKDVLRALVAESGAPPGAARVAERSTT